MKDIISIFHDKVENCHVRVFVVVFGGNKLICYIDKMVNLFESHNTLTIIVLVNMSWTV